MTMMNSVARGFLLQRALHLAAAVAAVASAAPDPTKSNLRRSGSFSGDYSSETFFAVTGIDRPESPLTPAGLSIEIGNPKPADSHWYSVTVVSYGNYTGSAVNLGPFDYGRPSASLKYAWQPLFDGEYEIIVHELKTLVPAQEATIPLSEPVRVSVENKPGASSSSSPSSSSSSLELLRERMERLPPCQAVNKHGWYTSWMGDWIGPGTGILPNHAAALRTGWSFLPHRDCAMEYFTTADLAFLPRLPHMKYIHVIGTSRERGVFLTLVDMILQRSEKDNLPDSVISKCWGRAVVQKLNLQLTYQDWRSSYFEPRDAQLNVLCHNDHVVREGGSLLIDNGFKVWQEIFQDPNSWPNVILMSASGRMDGFSYDLDYDLDLFVKNIPPAWEGTLFLTDGTFSAMRAGRGHVHEYQAYKDKLQSLSGRINDRRVQWLDGWGLSSTMRLHAEEGPDHVTSSQHFHSLCDQVYQGPDGNEESMRVCSNITEVVAQVLLGHTLGTKREFLERAIRFPAKPAAEMRYCHNCPKELLPFHITPNPEMTCSTGSFHKRTDSEVAGGVKNICPAACLELEVSNRIETQSGYAYERRCPMDVFLAGTANKPKADGGEGIPGLMHRWFSVLVFAVLMGTVYKKNRWMIKSQILRLRRSVSHSC